MRIMFHIENIQIMKETDLIRLEIIALVTDWEPILTPLQRI